MNGRDYATDFQTREENERRYIEGYFVRFDDKYQIGENAYETISKDAFQNMNSRNVPVLWNHNKDLILGSTENGTAKFRIDDVGVWGSVEINMSDPMAVGALARVERGDVRGSSFGFGIEKEQVIRHDDGTTEFRLDLVDVYEFSPCTFPAYKATAISARSEELEQMEKRQLDAKKDELKERLKGIGIKNTATEKA